MAQRQRRSLVLVILFSALLCLVAIAQPLLVLSEESAKNQRSTLDARTLIAALPLKVRLKIEPALLREFIDGDLRSGSAMQAGAGAGTHKTYLVHLAERADVQSAGLMARGPERREAVATQLQKTAERSQGPILSWLESRSADGRTSRVQSYWIFNGLAVTGDLSSMLELAARPDVEAVRANHAHYLSTRRVGSVAQSPAAEWNVEKIRADEVWESYGLTGEGVVVANLDTGVDWRHPALQRKYRGYNESDPAASDHNYNWIDFTDTYPDEPGPSEPYVGVYSDHGTHTMGTLVGSEADGTNRVGVAPGASWIAVKVFDDEGVGYDADIHSGFQWILAPTDLNGEHPRPDLAPDILCNSWGDSDGSNLSYWDDILALEAAGVMSVYSAGNDGPDAATVGSPASYPFAFSVGATASDDSIAGLSSRGPSPWGYTEPQVAAPGVNVRSTVAGGGYEGGWSGTSMAAPHAAGLAALLWQADRQYNMTEGPGNPTITLTRTKQVITSTAFHPADQIEVPDNTFGWGRVDAYQAVATIVESGTFWGHVSDAVSGSPISSALVTMSRAGFPGEAGASTDAGGWYTFSVAAGTYDVTTARFGYLSQTVQDVEVIAHTTTQLDFELEPSPTTMAVGQITAVASGQPVSASVSLEGTPVATITDASGRYTFTAPSGDYQLLVWPAFPGSRGRREPVSLRPGEIETYDFALERAPSILLVDADSWVPATEGSYYEQALRQLLYSYAVHVVDDMDAVPSSADMESFDIVIWSQPESSPGSLDAWESLSAYLDAGGRLFISGQDIGFWDDFCELGLEYYREYLHARYVLSDVESTRVTGYAGSIMQGLDLVLNAPDSARNQESPSEIAVADILGSPVLEYEGNGVAGLQADDCTHRVVYLAFGLGGSGPAAARATLLGRAIEWLARPAPGQAIEAAAQPSGSVAEAGSVAIHTVTLINRGAEPDSFDLSLSGSVWPTSVWDEYGNSRISATGELGACDTQRVQVRVEVPPEALIGDGDDVVFAATSATDPAVTADLKLSTVFLPSWQSERPMPMARYRHAAVVDDGCAIYVLGGIGGDYSDVILDVTERYAVNEDRWETVAEKPTAVGNVGAAILDGLIYVVGGYDDSLSEPYLDIVEVYDPGTDSWSAVSSLPRTLCGAAVAATGGKIYAFGGSHAGGELDTTYAYDPLDDSWTEMQPMPGGSRAYAAAAVLNGRVYVAGGWPSMKLVECYDPVADEWTTVAPMRTGRQSSGLVAFENCLYAIGGGQAWEAVGSVERYDPVLGIWQDTPQLRGAEHAACAAVVAGPRIFTLGGTGAVTGRDVESLLLGPSLGLSRVSVDRSTATTGDTLTYEIRLRNASRSVLQRARVLNPIPAEVRYLLGSATGGAVYDEVENQVTWEGSLDSGASRLQTFRVEVVDGLPNNTNITNTTFLYDASCGRLAPTVAVTVFAPDLSPSLKTVDKAVALAGDTLEYTVRLLNAGPFAMEGVSLVDPVPVDTEYLTATVEGGGVYDPVLNRVSWQGTVPAGQPGSVAYWEDSDAEDVRFNWIDATGGTRLDAGDDTSSGPLDLGFSFDFWGQAYSEVYVNSNGQVLFGSGVGVPINTALPNPSSPNNFIAAFWDDLDPGAAGAIYYQTFGTAPDRQAVIEWADVPRFGGSDRFTFEVVLYEETGEIVVQYLRLEGDRGDGDSATVGIENAEGTEGAQYLFNGQGPGFPLHGSLAVRLTPSRATVHGEHSVAYRVQASPNALPGSRIANTVAIDDGAGHTYDREVATILEGADLSPSLKLVDRANASSGDIVTYSIRLVNAGTLPATDVSLEDPLPDGTSYVAGSATGGASYDAGNRTIRWNGTVGTWSWSEYTWEDSDSGEVRYEWIDVSGGQVVPPADDAFRGPYPLGFTFTFYEQEYTQFYVNTNGQVLLGEGSDAYINRPIPTVDAPNAFIAPFWDDLTPDQAGSIRYGSYGLAPDRYAVIAWEGVPAYGGGGSLTFEAVLFERDGSILLQYESLQGTVADGIGATVGIEDPSGAQGIEYVYNGRGAGYPVHDELAVLIAPKKEYTELGFRVSIDEDLPPATLITNTVVIAASPVITYERSAALMVNPVELDVALSCNAEEAGVGDMLTYAISLTNRGLTRIPAATLSDAIPDRTEYVPGSATGGVIYDEARNEVAWTGALEPEEARGFTFSVATDPSSPDGTVVTNTVYAEDGFGTTLQRSVSTTLRGPDMSWSDKRVHPKVADPGELVTYTIRLRNTGEGDAAAEMSDVLPSGIDYVPGSLWASGGEVEYANGVVTWQGEVISSGMVLVRYGALVRSDLSRGARIRNIATIKPQSGQPLERSCSAWVGSALLSLPLVFR